eukprot:TRINITY_DN7118_c0_g1_i2.p1 TRINITY_DN7118_c0_g1~~TRINITY_DN7118_c0_g1_i2.p1  ORF type:complete len:497 (+),score=116.54 TRINITY_DN7118_c0_g1_i2:29-1519(+)
MDRVLDAEGILVELRDSLREVVKICTKMSVIELQKADFNSAIVKFQNALKTAQTVTKGAPVEIEYVNASNELINNIKKLLHNKSTLQKHAKEEELCNTAALVYKDKFLEYVDCIRLIEESHLNDHHDNVVNHPGENIEDLHAQLATLKAQLHESKARNNNNNDDDYSTEIVYPDTFPNLNHDDIEEHYSIDFETKLGSGAFSIVFKGRHRAEDQDYALKLIDLETDVQNIKKELYILSKISHPNIVNFKEVFNSEEGFYIITDLADGGELFDRIINLERYTEEDASLLMKQIITAVDYLHQNNIVHRDLKPENILLDSSFKTIKIADFGLATLVKNDNQELFDIVGTLPYMAPEMVYLRHKIEPIVGYNKGTDIWALGVILYVLLFGCYPFTAHDDEGLMEQIEVGDWSWNGRDVDHVSDTGKKFIEWMLEVHPKDRPTSRQLLEHPWISGGIELSHDQLTSTKENIGRIQATKKWKTLTLGLCHPKQKIYQQQQP